MVLESDTQKTRPRDQHGGQRHGAGNRKVEIAGGERDDEGQRQHHQHRLAAEHDGIGIPGKHRLGLERADQQDQQAPGHQQSVALQPVLQAECGALARLALHLRLELADLFFQRRDALFVILAVACVHGSHPGLVQFIGTDRKQCSAMVSLVTSAPVSCQTTSPREKIITRWHNCAS